MPDAVGSAAMARSRALPATLDVMSGLPSGVRAGSACAGTPGVAGTHLELVRAFEKSSVMSGSMVFRIPLAFAPRSSSAVSAFSVRSLAGVKNSSMVWPLSIVIITTMAWPPKRVSYWRSSW